MTRRKTSKTSKNTSGAKKRSGSARSKTTTRPAKADVLTRLSGNEAIQVLGELLRRAPELREMAVDLATRLVTDVDANETARAVEEAVSALDITDIGDRAGPTATGYDNKRIRFGRSCRCGRLEPRRRSSSPGDDDLRAYPLPQLLQRHGHANVPLCVWPDGVSVVAFASRLLWPAPDADGHGGTTRFPVRVAASRGCQPAPQRRAQNAGKCDSAVASPRKKRTRRSLWEIVIKHSLGKLRSPVSLKDFLEWRVYQSSLVVLTIDSSCLVTLGGLPWIHKDPFDRMLVATALAQDLPIVTRDRSIADYPVECVW